LVSFTFWYTKNQQEKNIELTQTVSSVIGQNIAKIVYLDDVSAAADVTSSLESFTKLNSMILYNLKKKPIYQFSKKNSSFKAQNLDEALQNPLYVKNSHLFITTDALYQETKLGYIKYDITIDGVLDILKEYIFILFSIALVIIIFSTFLANYYAKKFTKPIIQLVNFLEENEVGTLLESRITTKENNEYGLLYSEVNTMLDKMQKSQNALQIAAVAFETQSGMTITDKYNTILDVNQAFVDITGYSKEEVIGKNPSVLKSGIQTAEFYEEMHTSLAEHNYWSGEIHNKHKDGTIFLEYLTIQAVQDENNETIYYVASFIDITLQKTIQEKLNYLEKHDSLTGLANKSLMKERIQNHLDTGQQQDYGAIVSLNIKEFKLINEAYSYETGDALLKEISKRLSEIEEITLTGRISSDEFVLWFDTVSNEHTSSVFDLTLIAENLITVLTQTYKLDELTINVLINIGIKVYNKENKDASTLFQQADSALSTAKKEDKKIVFFTKEYQDLAQIQVSIYSELIEAIKREEFELYYQLQYNAQYKPYGAEALIRWNHASKVVSPDVFIPIAEKSGLIIELGDWVIHTACKQLEVWKEDSKTEKLTIAVNVSAKQFMHKDFIQKIEAELIAHKIKPSLLKVELTESIIVDDIESVIDKMHQLKSLGIKISLDDFGTGYSSLQYLRDFPLNQVKIDQSFVRNMLDNSVDRTIIESVLMMGASLKLDVIAEGVETIEQLQFLSSIGCRNFQGYYFAKPQPISKISF